MTAALGRDALLDAFDRIGRAAVQAGTQKQQFLLKSMNREGTADAPEYPR